MRPCLPLLASFLALPSFAMSEEAPPPSPSPPAASPAHAAGPPLDAAALVARDDLFEDGSWWEPYVPSLAGTVAVELDGAAPAEQLILTVHPVPEAAAELRIHPYRHDGADWVGLPRLRAGGYMEMGYVEPVDLDGDGRQELVLVGDTDGAVPADLSVVRWDGAAFVEMVWGADPAPAYAVADVDGDGRAEIVGLPGAWGGGVVVLGLGDDGFLRPRATEVRGVLGGVLDVVLAGTPHKHVLEGLGLAMKDAGDVPSGGATDSLRARWSTTPEWERSDLVGLLGLSRDGRRFLEEKLVGDEPLQTIARVLGASGDEESARAVLRAVGEAMDGDADAARALGEGAAVGFRERGDGRLMERVAALAIDETRGAALRADLAFWVLPLDPRGAPTLARLAGSEDDEVARAAANGIGRCAGPFAPDPAGFHGALDAELGRTLLDERLPAQRVAGLDLLAAHGSLPGEAELVRRALAEPDHFVRRRLVGSLPRSGPTEPTAARGLFATSLGVQREAHFWFAGSAEPAVWLVGLSQVAGDDDLQPYASRMLGREPLGAEWRAVRDLAIAWSRDERGRVRQRSSEILGAFPDAASRAALVTLLTDEVDWVRTTASRQLARHRTPDAVDALLAQLPHPADDADGGYEQGELFRALAETRDARAIHELEGRAPWDESARYALRHGGAPGGAALARLLDHTLASAGMDCPFLTGTATGLAQVAPEDAAARHPAVERRCGDGWLVHLIDGYERAGALEPVTALLEHPTRAVRVAAIETRGRLLRDYAFPR